MSNPNKVNNHINDLNIIINESSEMNSKIYSCANRLIRELALDPDNNVLKQSVEDLLEVRIRLFDLNKKIVKTIDSKNNNIIHDIEEQCKTAKKEQTEIYEELGI